MIYNNMLIGDCLITNHCMESDQKIMFTCNANVKQSKIQVSRVETRIASNHHHIIISSSSSLLTHNTRLLQLTPTSLIQLTFDGLFLCLNLKWLLLNIHVVYDK